MKRNTMKPITASVIVSFDFKGDDDNAILLVGRKEPGKAVEVINAMQGEDAIDMWTKLAKVKEVK